MVHRLIQALETEQMKSSVPVFKVGDTVRVGVRVDEGDGKFRTQMFEGIVIRREKAGIRESFTVRRISFGEGVERKFPVHSPTVQKIEVVRGGRVRRSKLYYLRKTSGKGSRIEEERRKTEVSQAAAPTAAATA